MQPIAHPLVVPVALGLALLGQQQIDIPAFRPVEAVEVLTDQAFSSVGQVRAADRATEITHMDLPGACFRVCAFLQSYHILSPIDTCGVGFMRDIKICY
jgi:hypothetical protein